MAARISPVDPPYEEGVAKTLERMMPPGVEPLKLFRTVAHNPHVLEKFRTTGAYILNFGRVEPIEREILIHRTCARCGCEYELGCPRGRVRRGGRAVAGAGGRDRQR